MRTAVSLVTRKDAQLRERRRPPLKRLVATAERDGRSPAYSRGRRSIPARGVGWLDFYCRRDDSVMDRREFIGTIAGCLLAVPLAASAQQQPVKVFRIGFLGAESAISYGSRVDAFRAGLRDF